MVLLERSEYSQAEESAIPDDERPSNGRTEGDLNVPKSMFVEPRPGCKRLDTISSTLKGLTLHPNRINAHRYLRVAQRLVNRSCGPDLLCRALAPCLGFCSRARWFDTPPSRCLGQRSRRYRAPDAKANAVTPRAVVREHGVVG
jgi:hypothetical protein